MKHDSNEHDAGWLRIGVAAHLARSYGEDEREFVETLALLLQNALPDAVEVERGGVFWAKARPVKRLEIELGDELFALHSEGGHLHPQITRKVRGVAIKTETPEVAEWIERLSLNLSQRASSSREARESLEKWIA